MHILQHTQYLNIPTELQHTAILDYDKKVSGKKVITCDMVTRQLIFHNSKKDCKISVHVASYQYKP